MEDRKDEQGNAAGDSPSVHPLSSILYPLSSILYRDDLTRIFLIGPRGSGKSTVARLLAAALRWDWLDADDEVEKRCGRSIRQLFEAEGEVGFRDREAAVLAELCRLRRHVIATGGGVVLRPSNRDALRAAGCIVWLTADVETLWQRLQSDGSTAERRPALTVGGREEIAQIMRIREPLYRQCADYVVDTAGRSVHDIVAEIVRWLNRAEPRT
jgi:shikimate kinase